MLFPSNVKELFKLCYLFFFFLQKIAFEENVRRQVETGSSPYPDIEAECTAPPLCQEFQTARLILSHFGLLSIEALQVIIWKLINTLDETSVL